MAKTVALPVRDYLPARRPVLVFAALIAVVAIGSHTPLPGLDAGLIEQAFIGGNNWNVSLFAGWIAPLLAVLCFTEIARLAIPPFRRWEAAADQNADLVTFGMRLAALALSAWQGYVIWVSLEYSSLEGTDYGPLDMVAFVGTIVAATALLIWLAETVSTPRLGGIWLLIAAAALLEFWPEISRLGDLFRIGVVPARHLVLLGLGVVGATGAAVFAYLSLETRPVHLKSPRPIPTGLLLWPPFLAAILANYASALLLGTVWQGLTPSLAVIQSTHAAIAAVLTILFAVLYAWRYGLSFRRDGPILLLVMAVQIVLCSGSDLLSGFSPIGMSFDGADILIIATVMMSLMRWRD